MKEVFATWTRYFYHLPVNSFNCFDKRFVNVVVIMFQSYKILFQMLIRYEVVVVQESRIPEPLQRKLQPRKILNQMLIDTG